MVVPYAYTHVNAQHIGPYVLVDGDKLVIQQKTLYGAYKTACGQLRAQTLGKRGSRAVDDACGDEEQLRKMLDAALVILIQNADHATAVNVRRRWLLLQRRRRREKHGEEANREENREEKEELRYVGLILAGITWASKSSLLWQYRRWLVQQLADIDGACISEELQVCTAACDAYPRNHAAWTYRAWLARTYFDTDTLDAERAHILTHLDRKSSDHSAAMYLEQLLHTQNMRDEIQEAMARAQKRAVIHGMRPATHLHLLRLLRMRGETHADALELLAGLATGEGYMKAAAIKKT